MSDFDCSIERDNNFFRYRAAGIIISGDKCLFMKSDRDDYYYSIGGGVHMGEEAASAIKREVSEETGLNFKVIRPLCAAETFFTGPYGKIEGKDCHALEIYFLIESEYKPKIDIYGVNLYGLDEHPVWLPIKDLDKYEIRPKFMVDLVKNPPKEFTMITSYDF